ncbi:hypothetical protein PHISP_00565 [Aspergillus sp. HF37]|nr:hypothetical protein PHISP_00565 [Aspergillus sp. HF37]
MSFNAKNLSYETKDPPFLQKLRGQYGDTSGRLERPIARPRKPKEDNDDDEPTYVDEESNEVISKEEYNALVRESNPEEEVQDPEQKQEQEQDKAASKTDMDEVNTDQQPPTSKQKLAEIGGPKKRKQAKVVGEESASADKGEKPVEGGSREPKPKKKTEKKKKIKLSFDDE